MCIVVMIMNRNVQHNEDRDVISIYKSVAMVLVVVIHSCALPETAQTIVVPLWLEKIKTFLAVGLGNAAVPSFFFISAYLLFGKDFTWYSNMKKKCKSLMIPYLIINTFWVLFFVLMKSISFFAPFFSSEQYSIIGIRGILDAYTGVYTRGVPIYYPFWFIRDLFLLNVLSVPVRFLVNKLPILTALLLMIYCVIPFTIPIPGKGSLFFFFLGCYGAKYSGVWIEWVTRMGKLIIFFFFSLAVFDTFVNGEHILIYFVRCILGIASIWCASDMIRDRKSGYIMVRMSNYVFAIYALHEFYMAMLKKVVMTVLPQYGVIQLLEFLIIPVIIIMVCVFVARTLEIKLPCLYSILTGGRKKIIQ